MRGRCAPGLLDRPGRYRSNARYSLKEEAIAVAVICASKSEPFDTNELVSAAQDGHSLLIETFTGAKYVGLKV